MYWGMSPVEFFEREHVRAVAAVDTTKLLVLLPEIGLEDLRCTEEPQDRDLPRRRVVDAGGGPGGQQARTGQRGGPGHTGAPKECAAAYHPVPVLAQVLLGGCDLRAVVRVYGSIFL